MFGLRSIAFGLAAILAPASIAFAQSPERRAYRVSVTLPPGCADVFHDALRAQTKNVELSRDDAPSSLRVRVGRTSGGFHGDLEIDTTGTPSTKRSLDGATCTEVLQGLALVAAVTIDPPEAPAPVTEDAGADAIDASTPPLPEPAAEVDAGVPPVEGTSNLTVAFGGSAEASSLASGGTAFFGGFGELAWRGTRPRFRLRFGASLPAEIASASGSVTVSWLLGSLDACPIGLAMASHLDLRPCLGWSVGSLHARGRGAGLSNGAAADRLWNAGRVSASLSGELGTFTWSVGGGAIVPVTRETLAFQPTPGVARSSEAVYQAPVIVGFGGIDLGVRFP